MKTSIHFNSVKSDSEAHNFRKKNYNYIRKDLTKDNEYWMEEKIAIRQQKIEDYCKKKSGRKLQKNAIPIREAVVVIKHDTTLFELHNLAKKLEEELRIRIFQIAIHKDEGHFDKETKEWKPNYHAHLVADWQDLETGKTLKHQSFEYSKMQDLTAECLGMVRGNSKNGKDRLEAIEFKIAEKEKELGIIVEKITELHEVFNSRASDNLAVVESGFFGIKKESVEMSIQNFTKALQLSQSELLVKERNLNSVKNKNARLNDEIIRLKSNLESVNNLNTSFLIDKELYERKRNEYLKLIKNLLEKTIKEGNYIFPRVDSQDNQILNKKMNDICKTVSERNRIPFTAIVEIFKDPQQNKELFATLSDVVSTRQAKENDENSKNEQNLSFKR